MRDDIVRLPRDYLELLRDLSRDPETAARFPSDAATLIKRQMAVIDAQAERTPLDILYHRCCVDPVARREELDRRVRLAVDEWFSEPNNASGRMRGIPPAVSSDLRVAEEHALLAELQMWRRNRPDVDFDQ